MGLLDLLNQTYGDGGGLLSFLQSAPYRGAGRDFNQGQFDSQNYAPLTPAEEKMMALVRPSAAYATAVDTAPMSPSERQMMGMVQPSGAQPPILDFADRFSAMPGAPDRFVGAGRNFNQGQFDAANYMSPSQQPAPPAQPAQPPQASPIAVGNYQMPRAGMADLYQPQQASIPQNAQPTQGQIPPQMPMQQAPEQLPPALGGGAFGNNFGAGLQSFANTPGGLLTKVLAGVQGGMTGQRTDPIGIQQQNMKAQFDAMRQTLQQSGMSPQEAASKAMLAVMNPEAAKTIIGEALTNKEKYGVISEDPLQGKRYGFINERDQTVNGKPIGQAGAEAASGGLGALQAAQNAGVTGEALYAHLPPQIAPVVKAMIEGRQPLPSTTAMRSPATLALIDAAHAIDPTFDATTWKARQSGQVDFTSGKSAEMVRSANQTLHHVGQLLDSMDNLKNGSFPLINKVGNAYAEATGGGAQGAFRTNAHAVAEELSKVFKGSNLSDSEIRSWEQNLNEDMSPTQQRAQVLKLRDLLQGSLQALEEKRVAALGPMAAAKAGPIIKEEGQKVLERIDKWANSQGAQAQTGGIQEGATATNPQTGQKLIFRNGKWQ